MPISPTVAPDLTRVITKVEVTAYSVGQGMGHTIAAYNANNHLIHFAIVDLGTEGGKSDELQDTINKINNMVDHNESRLLREGRFRIIDAIFISHNDQDHHSGFTNPELSASLKFKARKIYIGGGLPLDQRTSSKFLKIFDSPQEIEQSDSGEDYIWKNNLINAIKSHLYINNQENFIFFQDNYTSLAINDPNIFLLSLGESERIEDKLTFQVLMVNCATGQNASSLVLYSRFQTQGYLFCADATSITFNKIIKNFMLTDEEQNQRRSHGHAVATNIDSIGSEMPVYDNIISPSLTNQYRNTVFMSIPHHGSNSTSANSTKNLPSVKPKLQGRNEIIEILKKKHSITEKVKELKAKSEDHKQLNVRHETSKFTQMLEEVITEFPDCVDEFFRCDDLLRLVADKKKLKDELEKKSTKAKVQKAFPERSKQNRQQKSYSKLKNFNVINSTANVLNSLSLFTKIFSPKYAHASAGFKSNFGHPSILPLDAIYNSMNVTSPNLLTLTGNLKLVAYDAYARNQTVGLNVITPNIQTFEAVTRPSINNFNWECYDFVIEGRTSLNSETRQKIFNMDESSFTKFFYIAKYQLKINSRVLSSVVDVTNVSQDIIYYNINEASKEIKNIIIENAVGDDSYSTVDWCFRVEKIVATTEVPESVLCSVIPQNQKTYIIPSSPPEAFPLQELLTSTYIYIGDKPSD